MIHSGSIAALAVAFGLYAGQILALNTVEEKVLSVMCILALTTVSCFGIRGGKFVQNLTAVAKISGVAAIIFLLYIKGSRPIHIFGPAAGASGRFPSLAGFGIALVAVLWAYEAWHIVRRRGDEKASSRFAARSSPRHLDRYTDLHRRHPWLLSRIVSSRDTGEQCRRRVGGWQASWPNRCDFHCSPHSGFDIGFHERADTNRPSHLLFDGA